MRDPRDELVGLPPGVAPRFGTTQWSLVLAAGGTDADRARPALERLLGTYWYPVYVYARRRGLGPEDAADATQEFLAGLVARRFFRAADPARGRFRAFLLTALKRFLASDLARRRRRKRGGGRTFLSLDRQAAERRYVREPEDAHSPERLFERRWAMTVLEATMERLRSECVTSGRGALFAAIHSTLAGDAVTTPYAEAAATLGMTAGALKTAVHRLRRRYGEILRSEISDTVVDAAEIDDEVRHLFTVLASPGGPR